MRPDFSVSSAIVRDGIPPDRRFCLTCILTKHIGQELRHGFPNARFRNHVTGWRLTEAVNSCSKCGGASVTSGIYDEQGFVITEIIAGMRAHASDAQPLQIRAFVLGSSANNSRSCIKPGCTAKAISKTRNNSSERCKRRILGRWYRVTRVFRNRGMFIEASSV